MNWLGKLVFSRQRFVSASKLGLYKSLKLTRLTYGTMFPWQSSAFLVPFVYHPGPSSFSVLNAACTSL